jgi:cytochrome P450
MEKLDGLPYLDAVVKESSRLYPPVENAFREATKEDVIPVSKPFEDGSGKVMKGIEVKKGDIFMISMRTLNRMEEVWGEDAKLFKYVFFSIGCDDH